MIFGICFIIIIFYLIVIGWLNWSFNKVEDFKLQDLKPQTKFSVIIPFRNEAENLPILLKSIKDLNYPNSHFEVILVDDESEDSSIKVIQSFLDSNIKKRPFDCAQGDIIQLIENKRTSNSPKKDAISTAIKVVKYNWIVTTDADCRLPKYWLDCYDEFIQTNATIAIAGPVKFTGLSSFFNRFQILETLSLQGVTIGSFGIKKQLMCNGANFAYQKKTFESVKGFEGNDDLASGDDVFLLQKFIKLDKKRVHFLKSKNAIVTTQVSTTVLEYKEQRLRWSSKASHYQSWFPKLIGILVLLANLVMVSLIPLYFTKIITLKTSVLLFIIKFCIDLLLIFKTSRFFKQEPVLLSYVFVSLIYPFVVIYIGILSQFSTYKWKGRTFKN